MSWQDRDYSRSGWGGGGNFWMKLLAGSLPLGRWFGIRVGVHSSLILFIIFTMALGPSSMEHFRFADAATAMGILFGIVVLHEFGHCFAARAVGGGSDEIILSPIGGLAMVQAPHRPGAHFITAGAGPGVNVAICLVTGLALWHMTGGMAPLNPFHPAPPIAFFLTSATYYLWWVFSISYILLLFNLLPVFPLDGGRLLQAILWTKMGYGRSMKIACQTGMVGAVAMAVVGLVTANVLVICVAVFGFLNCYQQRAALADGGPEMGADGEDFSASLEPERPVRRRRLSRRAARMIARLAEKERKERARLDAILEKVSAQGMHGLNWRERRALRKATARQRQRDTELERAFKER